MFMLYCREIPKYPAFDPRYILLIKYYYPSTYLILNLIQWFYVLRFFILYCSGFFQEPVYILCSYTDSINSGLSV